MIDWLNALTPEVLISGIFLIGLLVGTFLLRAILQWTYDDSVRDTVLCPYCHTPWDWKAWLPGVGLLFSRRRCHACGKLLGGLWMVWIPWLTAMLFGLFTYFLIELHCQQTPAVLPPTGWIYGRLIFHLVLISLLIVATGTDFRDYVIPDVITVSGMIIGVTAATFTGELQLQHAWIDWNEAIPGLRGPAIPEWIALSPHLHGFVWSTTGLIVGGGSIWLIRWSSSLLLGEETMGFGDVTLMAMIGSFLGWQPVLIVLMLAPLCGIVIALLTSLINTKNFLPYGPYLSVATLIVLFSWSKIWMLEVRLSHRDTFSLRKFFGDLISLEILAGGAFGAFVLLLILLRLYRGIPVKRVGQQAVSESREVEQSSERIENTQTEAGQGGSGETSTPQENLDLPE